MSVLGFSKNQMVFPLGWVEEINVSRDIIDVTTFGDTTAKYFSGPSRVSMSLVLHDPSCIERVLRQLGAIDEQIETAIAIVDPKPGQRKTSL